MTIAPFQRASIFIRIFASYCFSISCLSPLPVNLVSSLTQPTLHLVSFPSASISHSRGSPAGAAAHFDTLNPAQKTYAHHISRASFEGTRITLRQVSPESETIYDLILELYRSVSGDWKALGTATKVSEQDVTYFLEYAAAILGNLGNYKFFGDQKFIPRVPSAEFAKLADHTEKGKKLWEKASGPIYSTEPAGKLLLGYPAQQHVSSYYLDSPDIPEAEIKVIQDELLKRKIFSENTRLKKISSTEYILLIASASTYPPAQDPYGDYADALSKVAKEYNAAGDAVLNDTQKKMFAKYDESFTTGSLEAHIESQKFWVKDIGPAVESNIGFIGTYHDPRGVRGEWQGFVAVVNQEQAKKFRQGIL